MALSFPVRDHIDYFSSSLDKIPAKNNLRKKGLKSWHQESEEASGVHTQPGSPG